MMRISKLVLFIILALFVRYFGSKLSPELPNKLQDFLTLSTSVVVSSLPYIILGVIVSVIVRIWISTSRLDKILPNNATFRRFVLSLTGILFPVCECGNIPLARTLIMKGYSTSDSLTFLLSAPIINPITVITTVQAFKGDTRLIAARIMGGLIIANFVGWVFEKYKNDDALKKEFIAVCNHSSKSVHGSKTHRSLQIFVDETKKLLPALLLGAMIAGAVQTIVPRSVFLSLGQQPIVSVFSMMVLAFVVSLCSTVDAFFALAFRSSFTAGSIASFLVFGPMIDIKMLQLMSTTYNARFLAKVSMIVALCSALLGIGVNYAL